MPEQQDEDTTTEHVHVLVDASHIHHCACELMQRKGAWNREVNFDFRGMHNSILAHGDKPRVLGTGSAFFHSQPPRHRDPYMHPNDRHWLRMTGYAETRMALHDRRMECHECGHHWTSYREKSVDAALVTAMADVAAGIFVGQMSGRIALVSGDGDFLDAITMVQRRFGISVEVWCFEAFTNPGYRNRNLIAGTLEGLVSMPKQRKVVGSSPRSGRLRELPELDDEVEEDVA